MEPPVAVDSEGAEIIDKEGELVETPPLPIDSETGLPHTGIDVNTGLPLPLPTGIPLIDPSTGKKNIFVDDEIGRIIPEGPPPTDPQTGIPLENYLRIDGFGLTPYRQGLSKAEIMRIEQMESFMRTHLGYRGGFEEKKVESEAYPP